MHGVGLSAGVCGCLGLLEGVHSRSEGMRLRSGKGGKGVKLYLPRTAAYLQPVGVPGIL